MIFFDDEFDAWRSTECGLFHAMYHTRQEAERAEPILREHMNNRKDIELCED